MDTREARPLEERMRQKGEHPVLCLRREEEGRIYRYLVAVTDGEPQSYSVYAEYQDSKTHTTGEIPSFSRDRDTAESFCSMLERFGVTPLSLDAVYEDTYTP